MVVMLMLVWMLIEMLWVWNLLRVRVLRMCLVCMFVFDMLIGFEMSMVNSLLFSWVMRESLFVAATSCCVILMSILFLVMCFRVLLMFLNLFRFISSRVGLWLLLLFMRFRLVSMCSVVLASMWWLLSWVRGLWRVTCSCLWSCVISMMVRVIVEVIVMMVKMIVMISVSLFMLFFSVR